LNDLTSGVANSSWNVADAAGSKFEVLPGKTVTFKSADDNLTVTQSGGTVTTELAKNLDLGNTGDITIGDTVVNEDGLTIANGPSITADGVDAGDMKITNVADGAIAPNSKDAINGGQLFDSLGDLGDDLTTKGLNFADNAGAISHVDLGETLTIKGEATTTGAYSGANLRTEIGSDGSLNIVMAESPKFGNITINNSGRITGVAAGVAGTDAVNVDQLNAVSGVAGSGWILADAHGNSSQVSPGNTVSFESADGNMTINEDSRTVTMELAKDLDLTDAGSITVGDSVLNEDGLTIANGPSITVDGVDAGDMKITNVADGAIASNSKDAINGGQLFDSLGDLGDDLTLKGLNFADNAGDISHVNLGDTLTIKGEATTTGDYSGANLKTEVGSDGSLNIVMAESPKFGDIIINEDGKISGVENGTNGKDAVNKDQLDEVGNDLTLKGLNLAGNAGLGHLNLGDTLTIQGVGSTTGDYSGNNLRTEVDANGNLNIEMAESPKFGNIVINTPPDGNGDTGGKISGVENGTDGKDAVNKDQLDEVADLANAGWIVADENGNSTNVKPDDTVTFAAADSNLTVTEDNGTVTTGLAKDLVLDSVTAGNSVLNNNGLTIVNGPSITINGIDAGSKVISNVAAGVAGTDAVNVDQLNAVSGVAGSGWIVADANGNSSQVSPGNTVSFVSADDNMTVSEDDRTVTVELAKNLDLSDAGSITVGDTVINEGGLTIVDGPSITIDGIDAGDNVISNVADGEKDTDAANVGQLDNLGDDLIAKGLNFADNNGDISHVDLGETLTIKGEATTAGDYSGNNLKTVIGNDGSLNIVMAESPKFGNIIINEDGKISGVENGTNGKDAVNKDQLDEAGNDLTLKGLDLAGNVGTGHLNLGDTLTIQGEATTTGDYSGANLKTVIGTDGSLNIVMAESPKFGNITINGEGGRITGVAAGVNSTDAVNMSQLSQVAGTGWHINDAVDEDYTHIAPLDFVTFASADFDTDTMSGNLAVTEDNGVVTVDLAENLDLSAAGSLIVGQSTLDDDGLTIGGDVTVDSDGLFIAGGPSVSATGIDAGGEKIENVAAGTADTDAVNVSQLNDLGSSLTAAGMDFADNDGNVSHVDLGGQLTIKGEGTTTGDYTGNNLKTIVGADGSLNIVMAESPQFGNIIINEDGNGKITGVENGTDGKDAVNKDQLDGASNDLTLKGLDLAGNFGSGHLNLGDTLTIQGIGSTAGTYTGNNLRTEVDADGNLNIVMAESPQFGNIVINTPPDANGDNGGKISGVENGTDGKDAVNKDQLDEVGNDLTLKGLDLAGNIGTGHLNLGDVLTIQGIGSTVGTYTGNNLRTTVDSNGNLNIEMAESPQFGNIVINTPPDANGDNGGKISGVENGTDGKDAVNKDQLDEVADVANAGWNVADANGNSTNVKPGDTVTFESADANMTVTEDNGTVTVELAKDLVLDSVTTGQTVMDNSGVQVGSDVKLGDTGLVIAGGPSVTIDGVDAGGKVISNVAAGVAGTDAVNLDQLQGLLDDTTNNIYNNGVKYFHANSTKDDSQPLGTDSVAIGPEAVSSGDNSIAAGNGATSSGTSSVAMGNSAVASGTSASALGDNAQATGEKSTALGANSVASHDNSIALGAGSKTDRENSLSVGDKDAERQITHVKAGTEDTDAVNVSQLKDTEQRLGDQITNEVADVNNKITNLADGKDGMFQVNNTSKKAKPAPTGKDSVAGGAGAKASGDNSMALGTDATSAGEKSIAIGSGANAKNKGSVALGAGSVADRDDSISVGAAGAERQITNVKAGAKDTDAVNVGQLKQGVNAANQYTDNKYSQLRDMLGEQKNKLSAGVAGAMAMSSLPQPYSPGSNLVSLGGGTYQGQSAVALGISTISDNGKWVAKISGSSNTQGDLAASVGVGYQW
jgi:autotransporter adhesin